MKHNTKRVVDQTKSTAISSKIFVFPTSSQKDEKKDEMKVEGMQKDGVSTASLYVAKFMSCHQINVASTFFINKSKLHQ